MCFIIMKLFSILNEPPFPSHYGIAFQPGKSITTRISANHRPPLLEDFGADVADCHPCSRFRWDCAILVSSTDRSVWLWQTLLLSTYFSNSKVNSQHIHSIYFLSSQKHWYIVFSKFRKCHLSRAARGAIPSPYILWTSQKFSQVPQWVTPTHAFFSALRLCYSRAFCSHIEPQICTREGTDTLSW